MGRDKAFLEIGGTPLWRRQRDVLVRAGATEILVSARADQTWADGEKVVRDPVLDCGPLGGIVAALTCATRPHLAVLAVDLPQMDSAWFTALLTMCEPGVGAVGRHGGDGFFEPLAAIFPSEISTLAADALARGDFSLQRLVAVATSRALLRVRLIDGAESARWTNWNSPVP
jgi:molybdopterin-guanine dinucleotide biosynthesis protein A